MRHSSHNMMKRTANARAARVSSVLVVVDSVLALSVFVLVLDLRIMNLIS